MSKSKLYIEDDTNGKVNFPFLADVNWDNFNPGGVIGQHDGRTYYLKEDYRYKSKNPFVRITSYVWSAKCSERLFLISQTEEMKGLYKWMDDNIDLPLDQRGNYFSPKHSEIHKKYHPIFTKQLFKDKAEERILRKQFLSAVV